MSIKHISGYEVVILLLRGKPVRFEVSSYPVVRDGLMEFHVKGSDRIHLIPVRNIEAIDLICIPEPHGVKVNVTITSPATEETRHEPQ